MPHRAVVGEVPAAFVPVRALTPSGVSAGLYTSRIRASLGTVAVPVRAPLLPAAVEGIPPSAAARDVILPAWTAVLPTYPPVPVRPANVLPIPAVNRLRLPNTAQRPPQPLPVTTPWPQAMVTWPVAGRIRYAG